MVWGKARGTTCPARSEFAVCGSRSAVWFTVQGSQCDELQNRKPQTKLRTIRLPTKLLTANCELQTSLLSCEDGLVQEGPQAHRAAGEEPAEPGARGAVGQVPLLR